jgi:hypothetical protein
MATIALRGTETKKVVLKTIDEVQYVACLCCGCRGVPSQITVVFSGLINCPIFSSEAIPPTNAVLNRVQDPTPGFYEWYFIDSVAEIIADCSYDAETGLTFSLYMAGAPGSPQSGNPAYNAQGVQQNVAAQNSLDFVSCGDDVGWAYGGTATLSWQ